MHFDLLIFIAMSRMYMYMVVARNMICKSGILEWSWNTKKQKQNAINYCRHYDNLVQWGQWTMDGHRQNIVDSLLWHLLSSRPMNQNGLCIRMHWFSGCRKRNENESCHSIKIFAICWISRIATNSSRSLNECADCALTFFFFFFFRVIIVRSQS